MKFMIFKKIQPATQQTKLYFNILHQAQKQIYTISKQIKKLEKYLSDELDK